MIEQLQTFSASPEWIPPKIVIHKTKKEAKELAEATLICRSFHFLKLNITHFARSIFHFALQLSRFERAIYLQDRHWFHSAQYQYAQCLGR